MMSKLMLVLLTSLIVAAAAYVLYLLAKLVYDTFSHTARRKKELEELRDDIEPMIEELRKRNKN